MPSTSIPAVEEAIIQTLEGAEGLDGVLVTADNEPEKNEYVWLYEAEGRREFKGIGRVPVPLEENLKLRLRVYASKGEMSAASSKERAYELLEAVETALRDNLKLNGTVLYHRIEELKQQQIKIDRTRGSHVLLTIAAKARI